jgi:hypothetical protein
MPLRHVVMFKWEEDLDHTFVDRVREGLNSMPVEIEQIRGYAHGTDIGIAEGNFDYVLVADFDSVDGYRIYRDHPHHVLFIEEVIKGNLANRASVQYMTGPG